MVVTAFTINISIYEVFRQTFLTRTSSGYTVISDHQFRSIYSGLARLLRPDVGSDLEHRIILFGTATIILLYLCALIFTVTIRKSDTSERTSNKCYKRNPYSIDQLLLIGLFFSLLPMINIPHFHTYIFLLPAYCAVLIASIETRHDRQMKILGILGGIVYFWASQSVILAVLSHTGIEPPTILLEEGIANAVLTSIIVLMVSRTHFILRAQETSSHPGPHTETHSSS